MKKDYSKQLDEFTEKLKKIPGIIGIYYTGSTAKKTWDEYSDIDVDIVVKDKDYDKIVKQLPKLLSMWGHIKLINNYKDSDQTYAFIGDGYLKVEIDPIKKSNFKPEWRLKNIRVAYDEGGIIKTVFKKSQKEKRPKLNHKEFIHFFLDVRSNFLYAVNHYMRGEKLAGASELGNVGGMLFYYLGKIKGMEGYEHIRAAEEHLTKKEWNFLKISSCKSLKKQEFKRALKANWEYMKYLEKQYEKKTKRKLKLKCNDKEILKIIEKRLRKR